MFAEAVVDTYVDAMLELPAEPHTVCRQHVAPVEIVEAGEDCSAAAPYGAADTLVDTLPQLDLT